MFKKAIIHMDMDAFYPELSMGIDERDVEPEHDVKSIGHEETFARDIVDTDLAKREKLNAALDSISDKFGEKSVRPGTLAQNNDT